MAINGALGKDVDKFKLVNQAPFGKIFLQHKTRHSSCTYPFALYLSPLFFMATAGGGRSVLWPRELNGAEGTKWARKFFSYATC